MDVMELGAIGELVGGVGSAVGGVAVLATLIYLAVQVRHAREQIRQQGEESLVRQIASAFDPVYEGRNAEILWEGLSNPEASSGADRFVFDLMMRRHVGTLVRVRRQVDSGVIPADWVPPLSELYRAVFASTPGGQAWFISHQEAYRGELELFGLIDRPANEHSRQREA